MKKKWLSILMVPALTLGLAACGSGETSNDKDSGNSAASIGESVDYKIIGIDPGAGIMKATANVLEDYELDEWTLVEGSGAAMTASLKKAYDKEEPVIVTGWSPHWKFSKMDLKYLEDPKGTYGDAENIHSIARNGLSTDHPSAYKVLDQFNWPEEDMNDVMVQITDGEDPEKAARSWVDENTDKVAAWTEGAEEVDGDKITIGYVAWDTEIASTNVIAQVLTDLGYDVTLRQVEAGPMWAGVAEGSLDAHIAGWLPLTHADYYSKFEGQFEDLGANLEGTKIGLVVPSYMDIDSIEDLKE
ncbi:glycine betaine/proline transport system substrate-binding protein [Cytobacillus eiseniae]|uniref:Glycine betaine/proline transport system substrate-binding protein n=1 Tax=Cytobacillus eiseniae TaxID=762947 RepID=A0ABS4RDP3_9BACI|nr:glycine betaine ABC transporter substrate-binding protein [Cytobacillus eiseniae]MBP2240848.1 glycine betaine/proline transport system substrate-binding protein [Cytobacillus eiseniae]